MASPSSSRRFLAVSLLACFGAMSAPAAADASTTALAGMADVSQALSGYAGYVVFSLKSGGTYRLMVWHRGHSRALPVAGRAIPFDADAGPDAAGRPAVVYSRCARDPPAATGDWTEARGCRIYQLSLVGEALRRGVSPRSGRRAGRIRRRRSGSGRSRSRAWRRVRASSGSTSGVPAAD